MKSHQGLTLLEIVLVCALIGILSLVAWPRFQTLRIRARIKTARLLVQATVHSARQLALYHQAPVVVCGSRQGVRCDGDWSQHWLMFVDSNRNHQCDGEELPWQVLSPPIRGGQAWSYRGFPSSSYLQFVGPGYTGQGRGTFRFDPGLQGDVVYAFVVNGSGRVREEIEHS